MCGFAAIEQEVHRTLSWQERGKTLHHLRDSRTVNPSFITYLRSCETDLAECLHQFSGAAAVMSMDFRPPHSCIS